VPSQHSHRIAQGMRQGQHRRLRPHRRCRRPRGAGPGVLKLNVAAGIGELIMRLPLCVWAK
jgi:hypothetical protein